MVLIGFTKSWHWCSYVFYYFLWYWNFGLEWGWCCNIFLSNLLKTFFKLLFCWNRLYISLGILSDIFSDILSDIFKLYPQHAHKIDPFFHLPSIRPRFPFYRGKPGDTTGDHNGIKTRKATTGKWETVGLCWVNGKNGLYFILYQTCVFDLCIYVLFADFLWLVLTKQFFWYLLWPCNWKSKRHPQDIQKTSKRHPKGTQNISRRHPKDRNWSLYKIQKWILLIFRSQTGFSLQNAILSGITFEGGFEPSF